MGVDDPHKTAEYLQNTLKARLPLVVAGSQSALYNPLNHAKQKHIDIALTAKLAVGYHRHALDGARAKRQPALLLDITPFKCKE